MNTIKLTKAVQKKINSWLKKNDVAASWNKPALTLDYPLTDNISLRLDKHYKHKIHLVGLNPHGEDVPLSSYWAWEFTNFEVGVITW
jgi:hypothetical protein